MFIRVYRLLYIVKMETGKIISTKNNITVKPQFGGILINDYKKIPETFNVHFTSIAETIAAKNNPNTRSTNNRCITTPTHYLHQFSNCTFPNFKFMLLSTKNIRNIIKSLNTKNSHAYDEISTKLLKLSSPYILSPLTHICNKSLSSGIFPDRLKYSVIKPLFNPGEVAWGIFRPHKNLFFSSWHISWNHNQTVHIPFATSLPFC